MKGGIPILGIIFLGLGLAFPAKGQSLTDLLSGQLKVQGIDVSLYDPGQLKPSMKVQAERIYTDYERKGFFRLGIMPLGVMENVVFEICRTGPETNRLVQLHDWIGSPAVRRLEMRSVVFLASDGCTNRLECGRARIGEAGKWELSGGVRFLCGTNKLEAVRATLQVSGETTGQIDLATTPPRTINLFASNPFQTTFPKETP